MRGGFCHTPRAARRAKPAPLAGKRHQLLVGAAGATQTQKAVCEDAAFQKRLELVFDKRRQARTGLHLDLGEEGFELFLRDLIERRLFRAPPLVVKGSGVARRHQVKRSAHDARLRDRLQQPALRKRQCRRPFCRQFFARPVVDRPIGDLHALLRWRHFSGFNSRTRLCAVSLRS